MLITLVFIVLGIVLFDARSRIKSLEGRIASLEANGTERNAQPVFEERRVPPVPAEFAVFETDVAMTCATLSEPEPLVMTPESEPNEPAAGPVIADPVEEGPTPAARPRGFGFEDLFGRRLPIWAGGITLAVAGVLLVKYSIDSGLLSPLIRVILGLLFGSALIAGAEIALHQEDRLRDPRVRQSLAGAGLATLYAVILTAANLYGLIAPTTAFVGLAAVTALAMGLSLRFGAPSALLGLVGGLAAPALAGSNEPNVPLLSFYLALTIGGLCALSRTQRWMWLGVGALAGGAGWGTMLIASGALDLASSMSVGLLILALGIGFPLLAFSGTRATLLRAASAIVASAQMAALVATGGFALLHWGLFGLLSAAFIWLSGREPSLRRMVPVGVAVALLLAGVWPTPPALAFIVVLCGIASIYGGAALWRLWRPGGSLLEAGQVVGLATVGFAIGFIHFYHDTAALDTRFALFALGAATLPALAMALGWRAVDRRGDARFATLATAAGILTVIAGAIGLPGWTLPVTVAVVAICLLLLAEAADDTRVEYGGWAFAFVAIPLLVIDSRGIAEASRLGGNLATVDAVHALLRWAFVAAAASCYAWRARFAQGRIVAQVAAVLASYGAIAQIAPMSWLAPLAALALPALVEAGRRLQLNRLSPTLGTMLSIVLLWAALPLFEWSWHDLLSLGGDPVLASDLPTLAEMFRRLALPAALIALALWCGRATLALALRRIGLVATASMGGVALHILYKQLFGIADIAGFVRTGLAERTLWEALLLTAAWSIWRFAGQRGAASALIAAALAHNAFYTLLLHNPMWADQAVGSVPLVSLLIPAFAVPLVALHLATRVAPDLSGRLARASDGVRMVVILVFAFASLRQLFEGSLLTVWHLGQSEDICRSVLAIALAVGFLIWGVRRGARDWRIASLVLMIAAVAKVFLLDASGLEGLLRIASFLALGFSLIGIGWVYSRQLAYDGN